MGCGGACGGNCSCSTRTVADPRRFGLKANDVNIVTAARALMLEDSAGIVVILREQDYDALVAAKDTGCGCQ